MIKCHLIEQRGGGEREREREREKGRKMCLKPESQNHGSLSFGGAHIFHYTPAHEVDEIFLRNTRA